jgi:hypothetical protein
MLERPAEARWWGAAGDLARLLAGTRLLGVVVGGAAVPASPAVTLVTQAALLLLTSNADAYCATEVRDDRAGGHAPQGRVGRATVCAWQRNPSAGRLVPRPLCT